ncbi:MAG: hypothetical protein QOH21_734 [Acidobacteriota bacterium]|jgi:hypothetical protein|nr:hypothetical protein [Acidobacteriota bacterium]
MPAPKNATVTCYTWLGLFFACAAVSGWFVWRRAPMGIELIVGPFIGGVVLVVALSWVSATFRRIVEWSMIVRARMGSEPRDGRRVALIGTLHGYGELTTPFSRKRCVAYSYEAVITDIVDGESTQRTVYEGFAMVPLSIEHGVGRTRILAKPELPSLEKVWVRSRTAEANAKLFVESTKFGPAPSVKTEPDLSHGDGHLRYDYERPPHETNLGACRLSERVLAGGTSVCALGIYRADRRALVAPVILRTGNSHGVDAAWRIVRAVLATTFAVAIGVAIVAIFCANYPIDAAEHSHPERTFAWWEIGFERLVERQVRAPMVRAGMLDSPGFYLREVCDGCAQGQLDFHGRTIELRHARYLGGKAVHLSAEPGARDGITLIGERVILTIDGKSADVPSSWLQPNDIVTSLGSHDDYAGRVTVIAPDRSIRCRVSFQLRVNDDDWLTSRH